MTLPPYNPDAKCPKCGGGEIEREGVTINDFAAPEQDHHWLTCTSCGYAWPEAPMDAKESA